MYQQLWFSCLIAKVRNETRYFFSYLLYKTYRVFGLDRFKEKSTRSIHNIVKESEGFQLIGVVETGFWINGMQEKLFDPLLIKAIWPIVEENKVLIFKILKIQGKRANLQELYPAGGYWESKGLTSFEILPAPTISYKNQYRGN